MKLLIDECLHLSLVHRAHATGHMADHVAHLGLSGSKDWELMKIVIEGDYTLVTNNRSDFLALHRREPLHAGLIVIVPNVTPIQQQQLFDAALKHIGQRELMNAVIEVEYEGNAIRCSEYPLP